MNRPYKQVVPNLSYGDRNTGGFGTRPYGEASESLGKELMNSSNRYWNDFIPCYIMENKVRQRKSRYNNHSLLYPLLLFFLLILDLERIIVQFLEIQKFSHSHAERKRNLVQRSNCGIEGFLIHKIIKGRLTNAAHFCQLVNCNPPLLTESCNSGNYNFSVFPFIRSRICYQKHLLCSR